MTLHEILLTFVILAQFADIVTTLAIINRGGREANPIMAQLFLWLGPEYGLMLSKAFGMIAILHFRDQFPIWMLCLIAAVYAYVLVNNLLVYRRMRR